MEDLENLFNLNNKNIHSESIGQEFSSIATELMKYHCILQKNIFLPNRPTSPIDVEYRFLEIEFYYINTNHPDTKEDGKTPFPYPRNCAKGGVFLLHSSGTDICFKGKVGNTLEECNEGGGGILIRTLLRTEIIDKQKVGSSIVTGPWDCADALFNYTDHDSFPEIVPLQEAHNNLKLQWAKRCNDPGIYKEKEYCAYDAFYQTGNQWGYGNTFFKRYDPLSTTMKANNYTFKPWNRQIKPNTDTLTLNKI